MKPWLLLFLLLLPVVSATYTYYPTGVGQSVAAVNASSFNYTVFYEVPSSVLRSDIFYWDVRAGYDAVLVSERENVSLVPNTYYYNSSHVALRIKSYTSSGTVWYAFNGSSWVSQKVTPFGDPDISCPAGTSATGYLRIYDNNLDTGVFRSGSNYYTPLASTCLDDDITSSVFEEGVWWNVRDPFDVVVYVRDPYQQYLSGANVTLVREDGVVVSGVTDFSGAVLFELMENVQYNVSVVMGGFDNFSGSMTAIESTYAITLGYVEDSFSPWMGLTVDFSPDGSLVGNTFYYFSVNSSSSFYSITGCWFSLLNNESVVIATNGSWCNASEGFSRLRLNVSGNRSIVARLTLELNNSQNLSWYYPYTVRFNYVGEASLMVLLADLSAFDGAGFGDTERWFIAVLFIFFVTASATMLSDIVGEPERIMLLVLFLTIIVCAAGFMPLNFIPDPWTAQYGAALLVGLLTAAASFIAWRLN